MKTVLITGATGFIGLNTIKPLLDKGYNVKPISRQQCNLLNPADIEKTLSKTNPTHLLHLAWDVSDGYMSATNNFDWLIASQNLVKAFLKNGGERVVIAGTGCKDNEAYYCACKHLLNQSIQGYARQTNHSYAYGKIFYLYGENERANRLIPHIINSVLTRTPFILRQNNIGDYLYVKDVANALVSILDSKVQGDIDIGSGIRTPSNTIITKIYNQMGFLWGDAKVPMGMTYLADTTRLNKEVNWYPEYTLDQGLEKTISWWMQQRGFL